MRVFFMICISLRQYDAITDLTTFFMHYTSYWTIEVYLVCGLTASMLYDVWCIRASRYGVSKRLSAMDGWWTGSLCNVLVILCLWPFAFGQCKFVLGLGKTTSFSIICLIKEFLFAVRALYRLPFWKRLNEPTLALMRMLGWYVGFSLALKLWRRICVCSAIFLTAIAMT